MKTSKILLVVGSPRKARSTSHSIGNFLLSKLDAKRWETETLFIHEHIHSPEKMASAIETIRTAEIILLAFPLYVDQLPAPVIQLLEQMEIQYRVNPPSAKQKLMTIINCGFPETLHNQTAGDIMKQFSNQIGMIWLGSLNLGMGGFIGGRPLSKAGGPAKPLIKKLESVVPYLEKGEALSEEVINKFGKPLMPRWLYTFAGDLGWKRQTKKNGVNPYARPYKY